MPSSLLQTQSLGADAFDVGADRRTPGLPQVERGAEKVHGLGRLGVASGIDERVEAPGVDVVGRDVDGEASAPARQGRAEMGA